ncbi:class I SAM-dependent RNA methyltransferase [Flavimaricola marinus]|uniref:23S rRNA (Uracil(1939)-C(5))-methyltransferase RlmD n=1 Tax=Flavimaricola marinus TaxID=1819565 RepID=A0A238LCM0_9RHOB|nr:class I SAM-dependent RNA methyltransferase [Flavimaricola marinus]SMY07165.1 23S rRNA (uracil(1939)-C(5))-methyltransferase RlmD [Flavimaricola marinus]
MKIETLTHHGMGRATDGSLIARTLQGEEVEVQADGSVRILTPSADRVAAPCRHYKSCGGCAVQHARDDYVAAWKIGIVAKALSGQGIETDIAGITTSPAQSRRRARLSGRRTKKGALVGFHARASDTLVAVPDCQLLLPELTALIPTLEELTVIAASRKAEVNFIVTHSLAGPDVAVLTEKPLTSGLRIELAAFAQNHGLARLVWNDEPVVTLQPPAQKFGRAHVVPPPGAFLQATAHAEAALVAEVKRITKGADRIVDLFSGCGTFALPLAETAEVHAVESEAAMLKALDAGWRVATGLKRVSTETRDLFRRPLLPDELTKFDAAVIDPPRAGAESQMGELAQGGPSVVAMVSCNPVTFARDARILISSGYAMQPVQVVDQFRWSNHVEVVAAFTRS